MEIQTEVMICAGQEQALRINYVKYHIDKTVESPLCKVCGEKGESVNHIVCECKKLALREYKQRHDNVAKAVHWKLCEKYHLEKKDKWYEHALDSVSENDEVKALWDVNIQCDHVIEARRQNIVFLNEQERKCSIIAVAVPADKRIGEKENEKVEKYQDLKREIPRIWNMRTVHVVPIIVGSLGSVKIKLEQVAGKVGCQNWYFITPENYATTNSKDFEKSTEKKLKDLWSWAMTRSLRPEPGT